MKTRAFPAIWIVVLIGFAGCSAQSLRQTNLDIPQVADLRSDRFVNPLGLGTAPHLSWKINSTVRGVMQSAYEIRVAMDEKDLMAGGKPLYDSGKVRSQQSIQVPYQGTPVQSRQRYYWRVRIWDERNRISSWSATAFWEMGLLSSSDWSARWIDPNLPEDAARSGPAAMLRKEFSLGENIVRARIYATSLGMYELHLNGHRVGEQVLTPGWTSYEHRIQYQTYDVTSMVHEGQNALGALVGDGWYRGTLGWAEMPQRRHQYGDRTAMLIQMEVSYRDGKKETVVTDDSWSAIQSPIMFSDIYNGERYDARLEQNGWANANFGAQNWLPVKSMQSPSAQLISPAGPKILRMEELKPAKIFAAPSGATIVDMGQNMVGWVRLRVRGPAGTVVRLRHGELLDHSGNLYTENLRTARQTIEYVLKGGGEEVFEPHFTYQGFRYVSVEGYPGRMTADSLTGIVIYSGMALTGALETSNPLINQLQQNIVWSLKGNLVAVPSDCPQRDERLGWTGDAQLASAAASWNLDVDGVFRNWLGDLVADQTEAGAVPWIVPDLHHKLAVGPPFWKTKETLNSVGTAGWSDAVTVVPWNLYLMYGDVSTLSQAYEAMSRWVSYVQGRATAFIWSNDFQFGDWLDVSSTDSEVPMGATSNDLIATAYFAHSVDILRRAARVLGKNSEASEYTALFENIRSAFVQQFVSNTGKVGEGTQTAYVLALDFELLPEQLRPAAAAQLANDVRARGHLMTGILGTPHLLNVLSEFGYDDLAYELFTREKYPSWLYPVLHGGTTVWERWDGIEPTGSLQNPTMNSFNHYMNTAVGEWMYRTMVGINPDPDSPGFKHSVIDPHPGGGLTLAKGKLETEYGTLSSGWSLDRSVFTLEVTVPANTSATVRLPRARMKEVYEGDLLLRDAPAILSIKQDGGKTVVDVPAGEYRFRYHWSGN